MGSFKGHVLPGTLLIWCGGLLPLQMLCRLSRKDRYRLFAMGFVATAGPCVSIALEKPDTQAQGRPHNAIFLGYIFFGVCTLLEGTRRLPQGASEAAMGLACALQSVSFMSHMFMQQGLERRLHCMVAVFAGVSSVFFGAYVLNRSDGMRVLAWASLQVQGLWYIYIGLEFFCMAAYCMLDHPDWLQLYPNGMDDPMAEMLVVPHACVVVLIVASVYVIGLVVSRSCDGVALQSADSIETFEQVGGTSRAGMPRTTNEALQLYNASAAAESLPMLPAEPDKLCTSSGSAA